MYNQVKIICKIYPYMEDASNQVKMLMLNLKLSCNSRFQRAFTARSCVLKVITLVWANQRNFFENATRCSKRMRKTLVATLLLSQFSTQDKKWFTISIFLGLKIIVIILLEYHYYNAKIRLDTVGIKNKMTDIFNSANSF